MNYCSNCGSPISLRTIDGDAIPRFECTSCDVIHYQNPKVVVGVLPYWEDKVLLCSRAIEPRKGYWNVPGGYLENKETLAEGASREAWEEAQITLENLKLHSVYSIPHISQIYMHFISPMPDLTFSPGIESLEVRLFREDEIPWDQIAFSSSKFTLKNYFQDLKSGSFQVHVSERRL